MASVDRRLRRAAERGKDTSNVRMKARTHGGRLKEYQRAYSANLYADRMTDGSLDLTFLNVARGGAKV